jgi:prepilin peptidase CpaA
MQTFLEHPALWIMLAMSSIAAVSDYRTGLIPNAVVAWGAAAGVLVQLTAVLLGQASAGLVAQRIGLGLLLGSALPLVLFGFGALGGGDVKLFAAIGVCVGPLPVLAIELYAHVMALCFVPFVLLRSGQLLTTLRRSGLVLRNAVLPARRRIPIDRSHFSTLRFAPAILLAAVWVCVLGEPWP